jgi:preprotein translocase subunit YajC
MTLSLLTLLAQTSAPTSRPAAPPIMDFLSSGFFPIILGLIVLYFFMFRSKNKQDKQRQDMLKNMKKGDRVQTIGGLIATVVEVRDTDVVLKIDENNNTKARYARSAIHKVLTDEETKTKE